MNIILTICLTICLGCPPKKNKTKLFLMHIYLKAGLKEMIKNKVYDLQKSNIAYCCLSMCDELDNSL